MNLLQNSKRALYQPPWQEHNLELLSSSSKLWNTEQGKAINFGNLLHEIFSKILTKNDVGKVLAQYHQQGILDNDLLNDISKNVNDVVYHSNLSHYFSDDVIVYNERENCNYRSSNYYSGSIGFY